mmetsp:Transcript_42093/g.70030  ORF Transcript_42093/g.70030 Transcript_42093/m.70030 type:complete len:156 (-) Transcript_42093:313-780(-)
MSTWPAAAVCPTRRAIAVKMQKNDSTQKSAEENAAVFADHFDKPYSRAPSFDASVIDLVRQHPIADGLEHAPTDKDIRQALAKLHNIAPGDSGLSAAVWKTLGETEASFALLRNIVLDFGRLACLQFYPRRGNLSLPGNYRGIMMLGFVMNSSAT